MKRLPPKLFEMSRQGVDEDQIQFIFDALIHAEETGRRFVNVYQGEETTFLFTNDEAQANQQLALWTQRFGGNPIGFVNTGDTWLVR